MRHAPVLVSKSQLELIGIVAILAAVASVPLLIAFATWSQHMAMRDEWRIAGPPCREMARAWPVGKIKPKRFDYRGAAFERRYGAVYCEAVPDEGLFARSSHTVCQFAGPGQLIVTTPRGTVRWEPGVGRHATVTIRGERASCVVGGWFGY
jgi:hypothetical protein